MGNILDRYSLRARYFPALLATIPALAALGILISLSQFPVTTGIASAAIPVLVFAAADISRRLGKRIEASLYAEGKGKPSLTMLRFRGDDTFSPSAKTQYHTFLAHKIKMTAPTPAFEISNPSEADEFYERAGSWLRENTRNAKKFYILFGENVTYGYRRNLYALKWPALFLNLILILGSAAFLMRTGTIDLSDNKTIAFGVVITLAVIHSLFLGFGVTKNSVIEASRSYARQLILSCERLMAKV